MKLRLINARLGSSIGEAHGIVLPSCREDMHFSPQNNKQIINRKKNNNNKLSIKMLVKICRA